MDSSFVLDSSLTAAWCFPDEASDFTKGVLLALAESAEAGPRLWAYEVRNCLLMGIRRKRISAEQATEFLKALNKLPIRLVDPTTYDSVFELARESGLTDCLRRRLSRTRTAGEIADRQLG